MNAELDRIASENGIGSNRLFYLATAPEFFTGIMENLGAQGMAHADQGHVGVVIEKPFGHDLDSARELNHQVNAVFDERQVFRIDHYLGKETVQNILVFRFANGIFEPIWNRNYIDHVQITAAETIGVEGRGPFYEKAGALRDVVQNHVMELLSFVAMEPPPSFDAESVRREKLKVWQAIPPIPILNAVRGQYGPGIVDGKRVPGYREEERVDPESGTETYRRRATRNRKLALGGRAVLSARRQAAEEARHRDQHPVQAAAAADLQSHGSRAAHAPRFSPTCSPSASSRTKASRCASAPRSPPRPDMAVCPVNMDFNYAAAFGTSTANGYERLLLDAMLGDQTLFAHRDGVETTWALYTPILEAWAAKNPEVFPNYFAGKWGPDCSDRLLEREGRAWRNNLGKPE